MLRSTASPCINGSHVIVTTADRCRTAGLSDAGLEIYAGELMGGEGNKKGREKTALKSSSQNLDVEI